MRGNLWKEITDAKYYQEYSCLMMALNSRRLTRFNVFMAVFSTTGVFSWKFWQYIPSITCGIIAVLSIVKLVEQHIIPSEKIIKSYGEITDAYSNLLIKLEAIWFESERNFISEQDAFNRLQKLQQGHRKTNILINQVHKKENARIAKEAKVKSDNYFKQVYNAT